MGSSKIVLTSEKSPVGVYNYFNFIARKKEKKSLKFDIIKADMNTALEFINSTSSAAGPERWLEQKPSTRSVAIYNHWGIITRNAKLTCAVEV